MDNFSPVQMQRTTFPAGRAFPIPEVYSACETPDLDEYPASIEMMRGGGVTTFNNFDDSGAIVFRAHINQNEV